MYLTERQKSLLKKTYIDYQPTSFMLDHGVIFERTEGLYCWDQTESATSTQLEVFT